MGIFRFLEGSPMSLREARFVSLSKRRPDCLLLGAELYESLGEFFKARYADADARQKARCTPAGKRSRAASCTVALKGRRHEWDVGFDLYLKFRVVGVNQEIVALEIDCAWDG
jgi:hypothetical protein